MAKPSIDTFQVRSTLTVDGASLGYFSLPALGRSLGQDLNRLPYSLRVLLENLLRNEDGKAVTRRDIEGLVGWNPRAEPQDEIAFYPARVVLQDFTGVPAVVDPGGHAGCGGGAWG